MTPQRVPVVEPVRQIDAPTGASVEPATGTTPWLVVATVAVGVHWLLVATKPQSSPGNDDACTVPWATRFEPAVVSPTAPQCPAVTNPPCTEKPTEQRN